MEIRLATPSDLPQLKEMFVGIVNNMYQQGIKIWNEYYPYEEFIFDIEKKQLYLLVEDNVIMATLVVNEESNYDCFSWHDKNAKALYLNRLGVNINYLRKGIGVKVLDEAKNIAKSRNLQFLRLTVVDFNIPAIKLYKKYGFIQVKGSFKEYIPERDLTLTEYGFEYKL